MDGITLQEMSDDTVQQLQANYVRQPAFAHTDGTTKAYKVTLNPKPTSLEDGFGITIVPHVANESEVTLNINELGALSLKDQKGQAIAAGKLQVGKPYTFRKVGTDFLADSGWGGGGTAQPQHVLAPYTFTNDDGEKLGSLDISTKVKIVSIGYGEVSITSLGFKPIIALISFNYAGPVFSGEGYILVGGTQTRIRDPETNSFTYVGTKGVVYGEDEIRFTLDSQSTSGGTANHVCTVYGI